MNLLLNYNDWPLLKLNEICNTNCGTIAATDGYFFSTGDIPYIKPKDISFSINFNTLNQVSADYIKQTGIEIIPKESILISALGTNAGNIAFLGKDAIVSNHVYYATIKNPLIKPKFLYYFLLYKKQELVRASKYELRVSFRSLQKLDIPIPSATEQDHIVQYLDEQIGEVEIAINSLKKNIGEIKQHKQQLINHTFLNCTEGLLEGWKLFKIVDCGIIKAGRTPNSSIKDYYGSSFPLFKPTDLHQGMQVTSAENYLSAKGLREARFVKANSVIICSNKVNQCKLGITRLDGACNQQMISFTPNENLIPEFAYFQMNAHYFKEQFEKVLKNAIINKSGFENLLLAVPDIFQQEKIVNKITQQIDLLSKKKNDAKIKISSLQDKKNLLLRKAFSRI
jgi:type I restriction enzyme S subunit